MRLRISIPQPPAASQVRVRHTVIGVNFIDTYHRSGLYPVPLPSGLGLEAAGIVEALGANVQSLKIGDRVAYCSGPLGAYAEANNVPADRIVKLSAAVSDEVAAASLLKGMTAQYLLKHTTSRATRRIILFHAAAGGVGLIACQWAKHLGATVIGTIKVGLESRAGETNGCDHDPQHARKQLAQEIARTDGRERACLWFTIRSARTKLGRLIGVSAVRELMSGQLRQFERRSTTFRTGHPERQGFALSSDPPDAR